ncbi:hypothetical protein ROHU_031293 [Labeo rohita]|uniref:Uncharacterized protein n=1 Tax=Labeo rohita TaxID=84645 RepID=A0A498LRA9_LABRO|nr:hypothetical protein ROHU_031293 [Labeo rohita]
MKRDVLMWKNSECDRPEAGVTWGHGKTSFLLFLIRETPAGCWKKLSAAAAVFFYSSAGLSSPPLVKEPERSLIHRGGVGERREWPAGKPRPA